jgi:chromate transport protein ChrA
VGFRDIFKQFVLLGWTAFGGPAAHIALFQKVPPRRAPPGARTTFSP